MSKSVGSLFLGNKLKGVIAFSLVLLTLLAFQNCGESNPGLNDSSASLSEGQIIFSEDFEGSVNTFLYSDNSNILATTNAAYSGNMGFRLEGARGQYAYLPTGKIPTFKPGVEYAISFWARRIATDSSSTLPVGLDSPGTFLEVNSPTFKLYETRFVAQGTSFNFDFWIDTGSTNIVDIDQFEIREMN